MKLSTVVLMITLSMIDTAMCKHTTGLNGFDIRIAIFHVGKFFISFFNDCLITNTLKFVCRPRLTTITNDYRMGI